MEGKSGDMQVEEREDNRIARFFAEEGRRLSGYVRGKLRHIGEMDAEDIVADVMLSVLQKAGITSQVESLPAYVYRALHNRIVDVQRSRESTISLDNCVDENGEIALMGLLTDESTSVAAQAEQREFFRRLGQAIDRLEARQRVVFLATELDGKSYRQLAQEWNEPVGTLLSRKSRAVKALREMLKDYAKEFGKGEK
jgi:RNA polymerase sigma factor (sigma-70 family)